MCHLLYSDGISALTSLLGFFVSVAYVQDTNVLMWENNMVFSTSQQLISASDGLALALFNTCATGPGGGYAANQTGLYIMFQQKQEWGNNSFASTSIAVDMGRSYKPWVMLHWILVCFFLFQGPRFFTYVEHDNVKEWVLFQYDPSGGPDFWCWVEYAVTSPLQIIIIAGSFYMLEIVLITTMASLQRALVQLGHVVELEIETLCLEKNAAWQAGAYQPQGKTTVKMFVCQCKMFFLLSSTTHVMPSSGSLDCKISNAVASHQRLSESIENAPRNIVVIRLECALFTMFGVVLTVQTVQIVRAPVLDQQQAQYIWKSVSWYYLLLSTSAKLVLEWEFIMNKISNDPDLPKTLTDKQQYLIANTLMVWETQVQSLMHAISVSKEDEEVYMNFFRTVPKAIAGFHSSEGRCVELTATTTASTIPLPDVPLPDALDDRYALGDDRVFSGGNAFANARALTKAVNANNADMFDMDMGAIQAGIPPAFQDATIGVASTQAMIDEFIAMTKQSRATADAAYISAFNSNVMEEEKEKEQMKNRWWR